MNHRFLYRLLAGKRCRAGSPGRMLPLSLAAVLGSAIATPAPALVITSEVAVNVAAEFDQSSHVLQEDHADTTSGGPANTRVQLGDGTNAFAQPAFAQAFGAFTGTQATYWVNLNADNTRSPGDGGIGAAGVHLTYTAVKEPGDTTFTLHVTGGKLQIADPDAGRVPLSALVELDAFVSHGSDILTGFSGRASLFGNGGPLGHSTFDLNSEGFDIQIGDFIIQLDSNVGRNEVGATLNLRPVDIPVDLSRLVDGTPITIDVTLNGEVRAPGAETIASAFLRDPAHVGDADPFAGSPTITFDTSPTDTNPTGPLASVPEASSLLLLGSALLALFGVIGASAFRLRAAEQAAGSKT